MMALSESFSRSDTRDAKYEKSFLCTLEGITSQDNVMFGLLMLPLVIIGFRNSFSILSSTDGGAVAVKHAIGIEGNSFFKLSSSLYATLNSCQ